MNILITGGAGFLGSNLAQFHLKKGDNVVVVDNLITGAKKNIKEFLGKKNFYFIENDITQFNPSLIPLKTLDIIYHLASPASPSQYKKYPIKTLMVNSIGTKNLLDFSLQTRSKVFFFASTSEVYGDPLNHPQKENYWGNVNPVGLRACYDEAKRFAEALVVSYYRKYRLDVRIGRIFNTYGPGMEKNDGRVISNFINQALSNHPLTIYGDGQQTRSFCYVSDMISSFYLFATRPKLAGQIINLGNPNEKKIIDLAKLIIKLTGSNSGIKKLPKEPDDPARRKPDITKAKKLLSWEPKVKLEEGLKKTINYFKNQPR